MFAECSFGPQELVLQSFSLLAVVHPATTSASKIVVENKQWINREPANYRFDACAPVTADGAIADFENWRTLAKSPCHLLTALIKSTL